MAGIARGNKDIFPSIPPNATEGRVNEIVSRTRKQMFEESPGIDNPARTYGGGTWNNVQFMSWADSKALQESYRDGLSRSSAGHDKVSDR
jgi:hypothetical protein